MKPSLSIKIFLFFLTSALIIVVLLVGTIQYFAYKNFSQYLLKTELERMQPLLTSLSEYFETHGSWENLSLDRRSWHQMMMSNLSLSGGSYRKPGPPAHPQPLPRQPRFSDAPGHPPLSGLANPRPIHQRMALYDEQRSYVIGKPDMADDSFFEPIRLDKRIVGFLAIEPETKRRHPLDASYLKEQTRGFYLAAIFILILAVFMSLLLSRQVINPIKLLAGATKNLADLDFDARIPVTSTDELGQLAKAFNHMADKLKEYESLRKQWLADISHELRTPLAILTGEIEAMEDGIREITPQGIASLASEVKQLNHLVDDLHTLSMADSDSLQLNMTPVDPVSIISKALSTVEDSLVRKGISVEFDPTHSAHGHINADQKRILQVVFNLLENTKRYTYPPGALKIGLQQHAQACIISFEDSSPGVPQWALKKIFDRLFRLDKARSRSMGGSGLGLGICRTIVERHGGTIQAMPSSLGGLKIEIRLPVLQKEKEGLNGISHPDR